MPPKRRKNDHAMPAPSPGTNGAASHLAPPPAPPPERVLVFPRRLLDDCLSFDGFRQDGPEWAGRLLSGPLTFLPRTSTLEADETLKQVIACVVPVHRPTGRVWCYRRKGSESRLAGRLSCLVGGHVSGSDLPPGPRPDPLETIWRAAIREMGEEFGDWEGNWRKHHSDVRLLLAGCVNDDSDPVGRVHFGFVYTMDVAKPDLMDPANPKCPFAFVRELAGAVGWKDLDGLAADEGYVHAHGAVRMETWSSLVVDHLAARLSPS